MLLIGNLDCETELAGREHETLPPRLLRGLSALAGLMAAFGDEGDIVWTPAAVGRNRWLAVEGLPRVFPVRGALTNIEADEQQQTIPWCHTSSVAHLCPGAPAADVVARVNHRRFGHEVEVDLGVALPQATVVTSLEQLKAAVAEWPQSRSWVAKAPLSAAGRLRLKRRGPSLDAASEARARRLFDRFGELLFEPWLERTADFGVCGRVASKAADGHSRVEVSPPHRLDTDDVGIVRAVRIGDVGLTCGENDQLCATATRVGQALGAAGYHGPFGIDAFRFRDDRGHEHLRPLVEINARLTFGAVAAAIAARVASGRPSRLVMATAAPRQPVAPSHRVELVDLVAPAPDDSTAAWLELR